MMDQSFPARAYWNQRFIFLENKQLILKLIRTIEEKVSTNPYPDLPISDVGSLAALTLDFAPDLILDLGRGLGNSTCLFSIISNLLKPQNTRIISICNTDCWQKKTSVVLSELVPENFFDCLSIVEGDILTFDYEPVLAGHNKVLVFWDAHGFDIAECVLGRILPKIYRKEHIIIAHDMRDARYFPDSEFSSYKNTGLWKKSGDTGTIRIKNVSSSFSQLISIIDFTSKNGLSFFSSTHSLYTDIHLKELEQLLGSDFFQLPTYWFWFSLNELPEGHNFTFPKYTTIK